MTVADRWLVADTADLVAPLIERVASRLVEAIELDESARADRVDRGRSAASLAADARRQQLLVGAWLSEELATINQIRLAGGERPLDPTSDRAVRARVVAELTGAGPLEPYMHDPEVEEIDVNSHRVHVGLVLRWSQERAVGPALGFARRPLRLSAPPDTVV